MKKYIIKGNHPIFKRIDLIITGKNHLHQKMDELWSAGYELIITPQLSNQTETSGKKSDKLLPKDIEGKRINEIMDKGTQICDEFLNNLEIIKIGNTVINIAYKAGTAGNVTILCGNDYVFIFDKKKLKAMFYVYDLGHVTINDKRGLITAGGHETAHEYWLDNGEYHRNQIR